MHYLRLISNHPEWLNTDNLNVPPFLGGWAEVEEILFRRKVQNPSLLESLYVDSHFFSNFLRFCERIFLLQFFHGYMALLSLASPWEWCGFRLVENDGGKLLSQFFISFLLLYWTNFHKNYIAMEIETETFLVHH